MLAFDSFLMHASNSLAGHSRTFDYFIVGISTNYLVKGGALMTLLWWLWFRNKGDVRKSREGVVLTLAAAVIALAIVRVLVNVLPFRSRPLHDPTVAFTVPFGLKPHTLDYMSSFPSDHAALFICLALGIVFISRRLGAAALAYVLAFVCFPRVYLGLHFPSDIAAGALVSVLVIGLVFLTPAKRLILAISNGWMERGPGTFYAAMFFLCWQISCNFDPVRSLLSFASGVLGH